MRKPTLFRNCYWATLLWCLAITAALCPASPLLAQQRSPYDLAAWLNSAASDDDTATALWALKEGLDINYVRPPGPALHCAIFSKRPRMVKFLLAKGANPNVVNAEGLNALEYAEKHSTPEIVQQLKSVMGIKTPAPAKPDAIANKPASQTPARATTVKTAFNVGDVVLHSRDRGRTWERGTVLKISFDPMITTDGVPKYLIENIEKTVKNYYDPNFLTTLTRHPSWTSFFAGDWDLYLPIAGSDRIIGKDVYTVIGGGDRLPPLRVSANGTYSWVVDKKTVIKGQWKANPIGPGIILLKGERGYDWLMYNTTDAANRKIYKADNVMLVTESHYSTRHGFRLKK